MRAAKGVSSKSAQIKESEPGLLQFQSSGLMDLQLMDSKRVREKMCSEISAAVLEVTR